MTLSLKKIPENGKQHLQAFAFVDEVELNSTQKTIGECIGDDKPQHLTMFLKEKQCVQAPKTTRREDDEKILKWPAASGSIYVDVFYLRDWLENHKPADIDVIGVAFGELNEPAILDILANVREKRKSTSLRQSSVGEEKYKKRRTTLKPQRNRYK